MSIDAFSVIAASAAIVAAGAAVVGVRRADAGRREQRDSHIESMASHRAAETAAAARHLELMRERQRRAESDAARERRAALERVIILLRMVADTGREEHAAPPGPVSPELPFRMTRIPAALMQLAVGLDVYKATGAPRLENAEKLAEYTYTSGSLPMPVVSLAMTAISEAQFVAKNTPDLFVGPQDGVEPD